MIPPEVLAFLKDFGLAGLFAWFVITQGWPWFKQYLENLRQDSINSRQDFLKQLDKQNDVIQQNQSKQNEITKQNQEQFVGAISKQTNAIDTLIQEVKKIGRSSSVKRRDGDGDAEDFTEKRGQ